MRKATQIVSILLLLVIGNTCFAQKRLAQPEIYIGAHAGAMASTVLFKPQVKMDLLRSPITMNAGLVFRYAGHQVCAIQLEANYMQRGWHEDILQGDGSLVDYTRQLDYIQVPLLMHLYFGKERFRGFFNLGPQVGLCIRDVATELPSHIQGHQYQPIEKPFDWGLAGGLGCYYRSKHIGLFQLEARMNYSLGTIYGNRKVDHFSQSNHMNLSLNLAYMWKLR